MTTYTPWSLLPLLVPALVAATVATSLPAGPATAPRATAFVPAASATAVPAAPAVPALAWRPCAGPTGPAGQECAELPVPLDYRDPRGPRLTLAVSRVRSERPEARRGTLLLIPGGPGTSGVRDLAQKGNALAERMAGAYDLVSLDPRGVGGSTTASCRLRPDDRKLVHLRPWPGPDGGIEENVVRARRVAEACARHGGAVLRSFSSANEVRDIDLFRRALGEEKLSAWGVSYGTYVGALYAQKYPRHTDRWVLDSSGDPDPARVERGWLANMAVGADDRFPDFAAWSADPARDAEGLRVAQRASEVRPLFLALAARLDREPKETTTAGVMLTGNVLRQSLQNALYSDAAFPQLARTVLDASVPDGRPALPAALAQPMADEEAAVVVAVLCNDVRWPASVDSYRRTTAADRARHPLTAGMTGNIVPCAFWKDAPADRPARVTAAGPSNVLMIQNRRDPSTPYAGALKMREAFGGRARLVTVERGGHSVYLGTGNACGDRLVTDYLTTGRRPARDVECAG